MTNRRVAADHRNPIAARASAALTAAVLGISGVALVAPPAHAVGTVDDWDALAAAVDTGGTAEIVLGAHITAPGGGFLQLADGDDITLDLAGQRLEIGLDTAPGQGIAAIDVPAGAALTVTDSVGGGELAVKGGQYAPGIGARYTPGTMTFEAGTIEPTGGSGGSGIGSGWQATSAGTIVVTGGTITSRGGLSGAGIGGGQGSSGAGSITISGGIITAISGNNGAGIGGGNLGHGVETTISGGIITATGGTYAAGIGGGRWGDGAAVKISGGIVSATGGTRGAGIGAGYYDNTPAQQLPRGTLQLTGTPYGSTPSNGGSAPAAGDGRGGTVSVVTGTQRFRADNSAAGSRGRFLIDYGWLVSFSTAPVEPDPATVFVPIVETIPLPEVTRAGHALSRWAVGSVDGPAWDPSATPTSDLLLVARWAPSYTISYDLMGGSFAEPAPTSYHTEESVTLPEPARAGMVFIGWGGTGLPATTRTVTIPPGSTGNRSYIAYWDPDTPFNLIEPSISGGSGFGDTLTASPGSWDMTGLSYAYQWFRDGEPIDGATASTYTITVDDLEEVLHVKVTAFKADDDRYRPASANSLAIWIPKGALSPAPTPAITGLGAGGAEVGAELTAQPGTWGPDGVTLAYEWRLDGDPIPGATSPTFTPAATHLDGTLTLAVTGMRDRFAPATRVSAPVLVVPGYLDLGTPVIQGIAKVGLELGAAVTAPPGADLSYEWLRNGATIPGATADRYVLTAADEGASIRVRVTATKDGYHDATETSDPVVPGPGDFTLDAAPAISGTPGVGHTLTLSTGTWTPAPDALHIQWFRDGSPIPGAEGSTYAIPASDENAVLSAEVTATRAGYTPYIAQADPVTADAEPAGTPAAPDPAALSDATRGGVTADRNGTTTATLEVPVG